MRNEIPPTFVDSCWGTDQEEALRHRFLHKECPGRCKESVPGSNTEIEVCFCIREDKIKLFRQLKLGRYSTMPEEGKEFIPEASTKFVQISREELEEMLAQARRSSTSAASGLQPTVPSSSSKPVFTKPGLARQFEFNSSVLNILTPLMEWAPDDFDIRSNLFRAITLLTQRNELLTIADTDPDVFDFYDQHAKAESMQTTNPILAAFFKRKRKRKKKRNPQSRAQQRGRLGGTRTCLPVSHFVSWGGKIHSNKDSRGVQGPTVTTVAASAISRETVKDLQNSENVFTSFFLHSRCDFERLLPKCIEAPKLMWVRENSSSAYENYKFVDDEIEKLLASGAILEVDFQLRHSIRVNPLSVAKGKKSRLILDLSALNKSLEKSNIKFEDLAKVLPLSPRGGFMANFDLKSGYHHVKIHPHWTKFLGFKWRGRYFAFLVLPFGLSTAPMVFTKLMRPLLAKWRSQGISIAVYLDDGLIWAESAHRCNECVQVVREDLYNAGFLVVEEKCTWISLQKLNWLGHIIDLKSFSLNLSQKRRLKCRKLASGLLSKRPSMLDRMKWQGTLASMHLVIPLEKRGLWKAVVTAIAKKDQLGTAPMYRWALNQAERDEIIDNHNKISSSINLLQELLGSSSTARELFDILAGLQAFSGYLSSEEVVWHCDNQTAIAILKKGSTKPDLQTVAQDIRKLCDNLHVKIEFVWISREFNTEADEATRETDLDDCV
ncbi:hypothetical protein RB195_004113 [Necator americanus]|uniref:Reverse transcriptase domain-containing protein n=1 Tax=Necator americanus TaxID=51031 RepID=A0ABR1BIH8_NECAM